MHLIKLASIIITAITIFILLLQVSTVVLQSANSPDGVSEGDEHIISEHNNKQESTILQPPDENDASSTEASASSLEDDDLPESPSLQPEPEPSPPELSPLPSEQPAAPEQEEAQQEEPATVAPEPTLPPTSDHRPTSTEEQPSTFTDMLNRYTPSLDGSQQALDDLKTNGLLAYDFLANAVLNLSTAMPSVFESVIKPVFSDDGESVGDNSGGTRDNKRPRENYALLSRFSWSALVHCLTSLQTLLLNTETIIAIIVIVLVFLVCRALFHYRQRQQEDSEDDESENSTRSPALPPLTGHHQPSSGLFGRMFAFFNFTILFSNLASYADGALRKFRSSEAIVTQTSYGHAGVYSMQGRRPNMEDCFTLRNNISRELGIDYYAVFDGHGGPNAALQAEREIFENISKRIKELVSESNKENKSTASQQAESKSSSKSVPSSPTKTTSSSGASCPATPATTPTSPLTFSSMLNSGKASLGGGGGIFGGGSQRNFDALTVNAMKTILHEEITQVDTKLVEAFRKRSDISGTTAVIAVRLVHSNILLVANVGDSRAILCDWKGQAIVLSVDHKPYQLKEYRRIVEAGGYIMLKGVYRVNGILAVSRALGDYPLKEDRLVIADPDILSFDLSELKARFMIVASDGFWDTFSNENAVQFVRSDLARHSASLNMADSQAGLALYLAKRLANEAYTRESYDNITIIVVLFEDVAGGGISVKGVGQATVCSGGNSPTTKTAPASLLSKQPSSPRPPSPPPTQQGGTTST